MYRREGLGKEVFGGYICTGVWGTYLYQNSVCFIWVRWHDAAQNLQTRGDEGKGNAFTSSYMYRGSVAASAIQSTPLALNSREFEQLVFEILRLGTRMSSREMGAYHDVLLGS